MQRPDRYLDREADKEQEKHRDLEPLLKEPLIETPFDARSALFRIVPRFPRQPTYDDLFYVDVTLLSVQARAAANGAREISWNSVSNQINTIEFTTHFPPSWQSLISTNGTGGTQTIMDADPGAQRYYRVRVDY